MGITNPSFKGYNSIRETDGEVSDISISLGSGDSPYLKSPLGIDPAISLITLNRDADMKSREGRTYYSRLSVQGLGVMKMDEWKGKHGIDTLKFIREQTERYLNFYLVKKSIAEAARRLVEARRARASTDHWERFCHGVEYICTVIGCKDNIHGDRTDLRRHLEDVHQIDSSRIETVLDRGKRFPLYAVKGKDD